MAELTQGDRVIIAKYPLNDTLDYLQEALRKAEQTFKSNSNHDEATEASMDRLQNAASRLLAALMGHQVAYNIRPKGSNLASDLSNVFGRVQNGDFRYEHYRALLQLVIIKAPDVDIWSAVLNLINTLSHITPPTSIAASFDGTPISRSSTSQQGDEQTKNQLEAAIFYEIRKRTHRNVGGFFKKYFDGRTWTKQNKNIYKVVKKRHAKGRWKDFPDPPEQEEVWEWLSGFQKEFLFDTRGAYYTSKNTGALTGAEAKRQLDFFVKRNNDVASTTHDWKDVHVIGEHKKSQSDFKPLLLQLSRYMRDVFTAQPTRRFVHGFFLHGTMMELWIFDRSGPYSSGEFNIHEEPEKFIWAIAGYTMMSDEELGLDTFIEQNGDDRFIGITDDATGKKKRLQLERDPFVKQRAIVCRGTNCYRTSDQASVVKFSWTSDKRPPEAEYLNLARERGVTGLASLLGHHRITSIKELRNGLEFPAAHHFRTGISGASTSFSQSQSQISRSFGAFQHFSITDGASKKRKSTELENKQTKRSRSSSQKSKLNLEHEAMQPVKDAGTTSLYDSGKEEFDNRLLGCLVITPAGRAISDFKSIEELLTALRDSIKAHSSLYLKGKILHRDISENNIIITDPEKANGFTGMLIDMDLAKEVGSGRSGARHQTGTMEFMAIEVLRKVAHTYRHDLESFLYVLLWICARRAWEREFQCDSADRPTRNILKTWYTGDYDDIAHAKQGFMYADGLGKILDGFPRALDCVKPLCLKIRAILFPYDNDSNRLLVGTPPGPPEKLYEPIIEAFDEAISSIAAREDSQ